MSKLPINTQAFTDAVDDVCYEAARIAEEHGFKDNTPGEDFALMQSEVSEALEDFRAGQPLNKVWYEKVISTKSSSDSDGETITTIVHRRPTPAEGYKPCGAPTELADTVIRIMHFCSRHGIDLGNRIVEKMEFNATRPYKHGNKKI